LQKDTVLDKDGNIIHEEFKLTIDQKHCLMPRVYANKVIEGNIKEEQKSVSGISHCRI
jgi:hypothetical protein